MNNRKHVRIEKLKGQKRRKDGVSQDWADCTSHHRSRLEIMNALVLNCINTSNHKLKLCYEHQICFNVPFYKNSKGVTLKPNVTIADTVLPSRRE